ncbi:hypothetical protein [Streptosporangium sp. NPDC049046]|uniref:hypothetical protein n=1 Tax=Streptosporangium sp. NPDC049046 TaxID=3155031 RepID=UPI00343A419F
MADVLVVPVRLAALYSKDEVGVVEPVDFTRLPYVDLMTKRDVRPGTPYISEEILPDPFERQDFLLGPGVHLHWSLPDALTRLVQEDGKTRVPAVPNRWLVTRRRDEALERSWVVESDYLAAPGDANAAGIAFPMTDGGVFVGASATEALAAHLGTVLDGVAPDEAENLLEALGAKTCGQVSCRDGSLSRHDDLRSRDRHPASVPTRTSRAARPARITGSAGLGAADGLPGVECP